MKWDQFLNKVKNRGVALFTIKDVQRIFRSSDVAARFLVYRWNKRGRITRVKRGLYRFSEQVLPDAYVANKLYEPSYVSLEYALSYHRVIPESVYTITSVTTKSTRSFNVQGKRFTYHRIKRSAYSGYHPYRQQGFTFYLAEPEKAFVDALYLRLRSGRPPMSRFAKERIRKSKARRYAELFQNRKLSSIVTTTLR